MSSTYTDRYNTLVTKSQLKTNFGNDTYEAINDKLISCTELLIFYKDSLFYMHLFNTLYLEILINDKTNGYNIEEFNKIIKNLTVVFDTTTTSFGSITRLGYLQKNSDTNFTFTFYVKLFEKYYHNDEGYAGYDTLASTSSGNKTFMINVNLPSKDPNAINGTPAIIKIIINMATGAILELNQMSGAVQAGTGKKYIIQEAGNKFPRGTTFYNSDYQPNLVDLRKDGSIFRGNFDNEIKDIQFTTDKLGAITDIKFLNSIRADPAIAANLFASFTVSRISDIGNYKPKISNIPLFQTQFSYDHLNVFDQTINNGTTNNYLRTNTNFNLSENIYDNNYTLSQTRKKRFRKIMSDILNTPTTNIYGYLLYQKIYYNCIVCNTSIQIYLREKFLNDTSVNLINPDQTVRMNNIAIDINNFIDSQKGNLRSLRSIVGSAALDYVNDKNFAVDRIVLLNELKTDFNKTLESLNIIINNYNRYIKYYTMLKKYVSAIIVFIIFLMIASIMITVSPTIDYDAKNTYYTLIFIILIIITISYYYKFRHVSLYEKFATADATSPGGLLIRISNINTCNDNGKGKDMRDPATAAVGANANIINNNNNFATFSNNLFGDKLIDYNYVYLLLSNEINSTIFVSNNKVFSNGNNDYLYKLYTEKVRENDMNKLKGSKYGNIIEAIKKQIIYLFNIALLISLVTIVLVASLIIYNFGVVSIGYIFTFALISLMIVMFYVNYIMIQQTRMLSSKKYWSVNNPSEVTLNQL